MAFQFSPLATMSALLRHSHASREHIRAFQDHHVRRLVTYAYENVPYYRRLFDQHGVKPGDIRGAADLPLIPITSKRDLQSRPVEEIVARGIDPTRLLTHRTSGSSGEPFTIRRPYWSGGVRAQERSRRTAEYRHQHLRHRWPRPAPEPDFRAVAGEPELPEHVRNAGFERIDVERQVTEIAGAELVQPQIELTGSVGEKDDEPSVR